MAAWTDNIVDAVLLVGSSSDTASIVGATEETNENSMIGWPTVWAKIDLSAYPAGSDVTIDLESAGSGGFHPYIEVMKVIDGTFDPSSPDFTKLDYMNDTYVGDGTDTPPPASFDLKGGVAGSSGSGADFRSETGVFYVFFTDWEYSGDGSGTVESTVAEAPDCINAIDVINPAASSRFDGSAATVVSGRVEETWDSYWDIEGLPHTAEEWSLKWTWAGAAGQYLVEIFGQMGGTGTPGAGRVWALFRVNGKQVTTQGSSGDPPSSMAPFSWDGFDGGMTYPNDIHENPWLPLKPGDVVEVLFISNVSNGSFAFMPFECDSICFTLDESAPATTYCTPTWDFEDHPLGDQWGSENGWGGQALVPDQIWTHLGITPYDEAEFPWGVDYIDYDMAALPDGTVYVIIKDGWDHGLSWGNGDPNRKTQEYHYTVIKKYDPGADTWTQIHTINVNTPTLAYATDAMSCEVGPDGFVYFTWWEAFAYSTSPFNNVTWKWHLIKLDPSDDSYVELGTGQNKFTATGVSPNFTNMSWDTLASSIAISTNGDVYVATIEDTPDSTVTASDHKCIVWRWNGSTWTDLAIPDPSDLGTTPDFEVNGENSFYDRVPTLVCARDGEGVVDDGFTLTYPYTYFDSPSVLFQGVTIKYTVGTGWHDEFLTDWSTALRGEVYGQTAPGDFSEKRDIAFDADIMWSDLYGRLVLVIDIVGSGAGAPWLIFQMNDDGDAWEHIETPADPTPPSIAGPWRQARNTAAIGPDGNIYRGMHSDWNTDFIAYTRIVKHSRGYNAGFANAIRSENGQVTNEPYPWHVFQFATTNYRLRIVGNTAYIMACVYTESAGWDQGDEKYGEAIYVFRLSYNPCSVFRPHVYRRVLG